MNATEVESKGDYIIPEDLLTAIQSKLGEGTREKDIRTLLWEGVPVRGSPNIIRNGRHRFLMDGPIVTGFESAQEETVSPSHKGFANPHCDICHGKGMVLVYDECPWCEGVGCKECGDGYTPSKIPCPSCSEMQAVQRLTRTKGMY